MKSPDDAATSESSQESPRRRPRRWRFIALLVAAFVITLGLPLANPLFPANTIESCTIEKKLYEKTRRNFVPTQLSDCGKFTSRKSVECTALPGMKLTLIPGRTYDLVVRGPRIPLLTSPVIKSANYSAQQKHEVIDDDVGAAAAADLLAGGFDSDEQSSTGGVDIADRADSSPGHEALEQLRADFSPENLRAFDYEQPPFEPLCQPLRNVMTTKGIQAVAPARAEQLLSQPEGTEARTEKLPCEGFQCTAPLAGTL